VLDGGTHYGGSALRPQGATALAAIEKGVHLLAHHIGGLTDATGKQLGGLQQRRADLADGSPLEVAAGGGLNVLPQADLLRQQIHHAAQALQFLHRGAIAGASLQSRCAPKTRGSIRAWLSWLSSGSGGVQGNMLDAKSQLSRLVKAALAGEDVIIASHGKAQVKLVPCAAAAGLKQPGGLSALSSNTAQLDAAFSEAVDQQVAELFNS